MKSFRTLLKPVEDAIENAIEDTGEAAIEDSVENVL